MKNIKMVEYTERVGDYKQEMVVLFDGDTTPLNFIHQLIKNNIHNHNHAIFCTKEQYETVFKSILNKEDLK